MFQQRPRQIQIDIRQQMLPSSGSKLGMLCYGWTV